MTIYLASNSSTSPASNHHPSLSSNEACPTPPPTASPDLVQPIDRHPSNLTTTTTTPPHHQSNSSLNSHPSPPQKKNSTLNQHQERLIMDPSSTIAPPPHHHPFFSSDGSESNLNHHFQTHQTSNTHHHTQPPISHTSKELPTPPSSALHSPSHLQSPHPTSQTSPIGRQRLNSAQTTSSSITTQHPSKTVLTIALAKAQSAVLLDTALKIPEAIEAYTQAVLLLEDVIEKIEELGQEREQRELEALLRDQARDRLWADEVWARLSMGGGGSERQRQEIEDRLRDRESKWHDKRWRIEKRKKARADEEDRLIGIVSFFGGAAHHPPQT